MTLGLNENEVYVTVFFLGGATAEAVPTMSPGDISNAYLTAKRKSRVACPRAG